MTTAVEFVAVFAAGFVVAMLCGITVAVLHLRRMRRRFKPIIRYPVTLTDESINLGALLGEAPAKSTRPHPLP